MKARLRSELFEFLVSQLLRCKRVLSSTRPVARTLRAVERREAFDDLYLHEQMLADAVRVNAYREAIERYVTSQHCVMDIGTGTGILAFLAAAKSPQKIYAVDHSKLMVDYARAAADANDLNSVVFVASSGRKFRPQEQVDVIVQEQMGIALFDEGMVETIIDLRDRCLKPGGRILPARFEFHLEPVQLCPSERVPMIQEQRIHGLKFPRPSTAPRDGYCFREITAEQIEFLLCDPEPVFSFDLATVTRDHLPKRFCVKKPIVRRGQLDGICMYFRAIFDNDISFSTGPDAVKTHWPMLLYRTQVNAYQPGEVFTTVVEVPDLSDHIEWTWRIGAQSSRDA